MMAMMMNSDNDNMMPLMMMMTMGNNQNNNMLPVLIMSMMNKRSNKPGGGGKLMPSEMLQKLPDFPGLYLESNDVAFLCTAGTNVGTKMVAAFEVCMASKNGTESRKKPNKSNKSNKPSEGCPKVDDLETLFMEVHDEHLCMFKEMAWLDESLNLDYVIAEADVRGLPANVSAAISWEGLETCIRDTLSKAGQEDWF